MFMNPEFSHILDANLLLQGPEALMVSANEGELEKVKERLGLVSLDSLKATIKVHAPTRTQKCIQLDVVLKATLSQTCVVSLGPVEETVQERFSLLLSKDPEPEEALQDDNWLDLAEEEAETIYVGESGVFDIGEIIVQYLSLAINPYPRRPDAAFTALIEDMPSKNPFATLKALKEE
jgi:uncharacterized metal-binding protein YceD (DUF177 family)